MPGPESRIGRGPAGDPPGLVDQGAVPSPPDATSAGTRPHIPPSMPPTVPARLACALAGALALATIAGAQAPSSARPAKAPRVARAAFRAPEGSNVVTVLAREYAFELPDSIPAGLTTFRLRDLGREQHHIFLAALPDGKSPRDLVAAIEAGGPAPAWGRAPWMHMVGGPNTPVPGGESNATLTLAPGRYVVFCVIPAPDGALHVMKGMHRTLTVTPSARRAPRPAHDVAITLTDYDFVFSRAITPGTRTLRITNAATQPHEMFLMRLPPGRTVADLVAWVAKPHGPPPVVPAGGITDIPPGGVAFVRADFTAGEYALICFSPDERDGRPHFAHGMTRQFRVRAAGDAP